MTDQVKNRSGSQISSDSNTNLFAGGAGPRRELRPGVNAYVVKPVDFHEFIDAVKELGLFWSIINVPPLRKVAARNGNKNGFITGL